MKSNKAFGTSRRIVGISLATLAMLAVGVDARAASPLDEQGMVLADGRLAVSPSSPVWGTG
ncbi:MAG: hypothetical protein KC457_18090, partial [Myxococcales bacterium]|nr:hypothetical protein [Myxococcales bacterium]